MRRFRDSHAQGPLLPSAAEPSLGPPAEREPPRPGDGVVIFARGDEAPSESTSAEARLAVRLARQARVLYVAGLQGADPHAEHALLRRLRRAFGALERDPSGALVARPLILPAPWPKAAELSGALLSRQLEGYLAEARFVFPVAVCAHPLAGLALGREHWAGVFRLDSAAPRPLSGVIGGARSEGWAHASLELERRASALASEPPAISSRASAFARGLDRPRYALLEALDDPGLDEERLARLLERLDPGVLLVRGPAPQGRWSRLRERSRIPLVEPEDALLPAELAEVALSVRLPDVLVPAEHLDPALALGLPIVASRESEAPEFAGLAWFSDDPHDLASRARAAAQERDDELPSRRRLLATERRFARLERALLARLGPQPGP
jgi:hypothetical protein